MRRRLFTFCSALSLLLCVAACVLWARSYRGYRVADRVPVRLAGEPWRLLSIDGWVVLDNQPLVAGAYEAGRAWVGEGPRRTEKATGATPSPDAAPRAGGRPPPVPDPHPRPFP